MKNMKTLRVKMVGLLATALILLSAFRVDKPGHHYLYDR